MTNKENESLQKSSIEENKVKKVESKVKDAKDAKDKELDKLKSEILAVVNKKESKKRGIHWGSVVVTSVLVLLAIVSIGQTAQSATILKKINSGDLKPAKSGSALPSNLESLPNMVGGC